LRTWIMHIDMPYSLICFCSSYIFILTILIINASLIKNWIFKLYLQELEQQQGTRWIGYVDWRNRPAHRGRHGGMLAASFILGMSQFYLFHQSWLILSLRKNFLCFGAYFAESSLRCKFISLKNQIGLMRTYKEVQ